MRNHHHIRMPEFVSSFLLCSYSYESNLVTSAAGRDFVKNNCDFPRRLYQIAGARISQKQFNEFTTFYNARKGSLYSFRLRDYSDYSVAEQRVFTYEPDIKKFKLFKLYDDSINPYIRYISLIIPDSLNLTANGEVVRYIFDETIGEVELLDHLEIGENLTASFEFDVRVRFLTNKIEYSHCNDGSVLLSNIIIKEVVDV